MGKTIEEIYDIVTDKAGYDGRLKLASVTGISRQKAAQIEDTPKVIARFKDAADEIVGQDIDPFFKKK